MLHELRVHQIELEMQNMTLRQRQEELDAARARYFDLYDLAPVGYITVSEKGLLIEANFTAATMLEVVRGELGHVHPSFSQFIHREAQDIYYRFRKQLLETGKTQAYELRMLPKGGKEFWAHLEAAVASDTDGAPVCRLVLSDITERKQAEKSLVQHAALLLANAYNRTLIEVSVDPLVTIGPDGKITDVNKATEHATGYTGQELIGTDFSNHFSQPAKAQQAHQQVFLDGIIQNVELELCHRSGSVIQALYNFAVYRNQAGEVVCVFAAARDIRDYINTIVPLKERL